MLGVENVLGDFGVITALFFIGILVFAECAFLFGLFIPGGDILLVASGVLAAEGSLPLIGVLLTILVSSYAGYEVSYLIGKKTGPRIFTDKNNSFLRKEYLNRAEYFYEHHGAKTIIIARFLGYVRTLVPLLAGVARMKRGKFIFYNLTGSLLWTLSIVLLGYWLGESFADQVKQYILPITVVGILLACIAMAVYYIRLRVAK